MSFRLAQVLSTRTAIAIGITVGVILIVRIVVFLWRDGIFTAAKGWLNDDPQWTVEYQPPTLTGKASKGFDRKLRAVPSSKSTTLRPPAA